MQNISVHGLKSVVELDKVYKLYQEVFLKTPMDFFTGRIENDANLNIEDIRVAEANNNILSSVVLFRRQMYWNKSAQPFFGIANVATQPNARGKGLSSLVIKDAIEYSVLNNAGSVILFTGINPFYERLNFFTVKTYNLSINIANTSKVEHKVRRFSGKNLNDIMNIYTQFNKYLNGPVARDFEYWKANLKYAEKDEIFLVAEKDLKTEGYIRFVPQSPKNEIWEFGYTNPAAFTALLLKVSEILKKNEFKTAALIPKDLCVEAPGVSVKYEPSTIAMAYINPIANKEELTKGFNNYCFWWTDNF